MILPFMLVLCLCRSYAYDDVYTEDRNLVECGGAPSSKENCPNDSKDVDFQKLAKKLVTAQIAIMFYWKEGGYYIYWCSGVLVTRRHFLTAAMCLYHNYTIDSYEIRVGNTDFRKGQVYTFQDIKLHEKYMVGGKRYHDIALVTLKEAIQDPKVGIVCLPDAELAEKNLTDLGLSVAGWGQSRREEHLNNSTFHLSTMRAISNQECDETYSEWNDFSRFRPWYPEGMLPSFLCAYYYESEKYACGGDAGRSLMLLHENRWHVMGILAFGNSCDEKKPIAFTRLSSYLDWIRNNIQASDARLSLEKVTQNGYTPSLELKTDVKDLFPSMKEDKR